MISGTATLSTRRGWTPSKGTLLVARVDALLDDYTEATVRTVDGWEGWFVTPDYAPPTPPRRWKMALITLSALYPIVLTLRGRPDEPANEET